MGIMSKILGGGGSHSTEDYVELNLDDFDTTRADADMQVRLAEISEQRDAMAIKDAVYDGDLVIADITRLSPSDSVVDRVLEDLRQVARERDGDVIVKDDDQIIVTPKGVKIGREKL
ncbi:cell division protein SepF [Haloplanus salilacus]|uniref:cell division protein SepF n=1 Tax=Haloplanus salilacus TaxID=2949994 RepID=UPI0030CCBE01